MTQVAEEQPIPGARPRSSAKATSSAHTVFLMYHELKSAGRSVRQSAPGYLRYVLPADGFRAQMKSLKCTSWAGVSVGEAIRFASPRTVAITFDDGSQTDLAVAAPILKELGFGATFYVVSEFLGKTGYLSGVEVCELRRMGFEIGCHSMTHAYLTDLNDSDLHREIADAKTQLEQILGEPVQHFSCPGGRYNRRVADKVRNSGFETMATSRTHANFNGCDPYALGRIAITRGTSGRRFAQICNGDGLWKFTLLDSLRRSVRSVLGNRTYDRLRSHLLKP